MTFCFHCHLQEGHLPVYHETYLEHFICLIKDQYFHAPVSKHPLALPILKLAMRPYNHLLADIAAPARPTSLLTMSSGNLCLALHLASQGRHK